MVFTAIFPSGLGTVVDDAFGDIDRKCRIADNTGAGLNRAWECHVDVAAQLAHLADTFRIAV